MKKIILGGLTAILLVGCASRGTVPPQVMSQKYINDSNKAGCDAIGTAVGVSGSSNGALWNARYDVYNMGGNGYKVVSSTYGNGLFNTIVEVYRCR